MMSRAVQVARAAVTGALAALLLGGRSLAQESTPQFNMTKVTDNAYSFRFFLHAT
jgi:hypothetical protein